MSMPRTPEKPLRVSLPSSVLANEATLSGVDSPELALQLSFPVLQVMDRRTSQLGNPPEGSHRFSSSCPGGSVTHLAKKPSPLRIIAPPTEHCPFSTSLAHPIAPLTLPAPVSSLSCFTFSDMDLQELANQSESAPPSCSRDAAVASPTSSQFLLMPPTPHSQDVDIGTTICVSSPTIPATTSEPKCGGSRETTSENPRPWELSSSTWLSDLGGYTETDRIFRHNLPAITSADTDSSPASTPALSPSAMSPSSQVSSILPYNLPTLGSPARLPTSLSSTLSPYPYTIPLQSSLTRLVLKPTGTAAFPSTLESLQVWRESVTPGIPQSEEPHSPLSEDVHGSRPERSVLETATIYPSLPSHQLPSRHPSRVPHVSKSQTLLKHAKTFGGRVKQLVTQQTNRKDRGSMDRGVSFRVATSQDSENGSIILIAAPPPPYDVHPPTLTGRPHGQERVRSRTVSEHSSAVQASTIELSTTGMTESGSRPGSGNRNTLRRLSLAALSTIKRF